jgi:hypothetical protein
MKMRQHAEELLWCHADGRGHLVLQLTATRAHNPARVVDLVDVVLHDLARDPVTPLVVIHAIDPQALTRFHHVPIAVDDERLRGRSRHRCSSRYDRAGGTSSSEEYA